ncbi:MULTISPECIES: aminopeptidase [unclassified Butyrivibrio]|uniref:aminopeptidase n=1 Tax=unclassified Butyrivibrio TaxID=2639466 RepID=UPI00040D56A6|nr:MULTISPECIES: aminopeptidase [unclassified Butyrivibrio]
MNQNIIEKMVNAMKITGDDTVLLNYWSEGDDSDLKLFESVFSDKGVKYKTIDFTEEYLIQLAQNGAENINDNFFNPYKECTVVVDILQRPAGMPPRGLDKEKYPAFAEVLRALFSFMSSHDKLIQITMPSQTNAALAGENFEEYKVKMENAFNVDYEALAADCKKKIDSFNTNKITIRTGEDCTLVMDVTGREWIIDAGEGAFPCGEIYIAPLEDKTSGTVFYKNLFIEDVGVFDDVIITVKDGRVTDSNCTAFNEFLSGQEEGARVVGELGIGMNPAVTYSGKGASLDEDALGTFHIGLGMNYLFGGTNKTRFHMDFVNFGEIL